MKDLKIVLMFGVPVLAVAAALFVVADPFSSGSPAVEPAGHPASAPPDRPPVDPDPPIRPPRGNSQLVDVDGAPPRPLPGDGEPEVLTLELLRELLAKGDWASWKRIEQLFKYGVVEDQLGAQALLVKALTTDVNAGAWLRQIFPLLTDEAAKKQATEDLLALTRATEDANVLKGAISALGIVGDGPAALALSGWLQGLSEDDGNYQEKLAAASLAIAAIGAPESATELAKLLQAKQGTKLEHVVLNAIGQMKSSREEMVSALAPLLGEGATDGMKQAAARALGYLRADEAVEPLRALLSGEVGKGVRDEAILALGRVGSRAAVDELLGLMEKGGDAGFAATMALRQLDREEAVEPLLEKIDEVEDPRARANIAHALGNAEDPRASEKLRTLLESGHENADVRGESARALGKIGDPAAVEVYAATLSGWQEENVGVLISIVDGAKYMAAQHPATRAGIDSKVVPLLKEIVEKSSSENLTYRVKIALQWFENSSTRTPGVDRPLLPRPKRPK